MYNLSNTLTRPLLRHVRYASVLASIPRPTPVHWTPPIVTPAHEPITVPSNNAFHPDVIPDKAKARINLKQISNMLDIAQKLVDQLQSLEKPQQADILEEVEKVVKEQKKLVKLLGNSKQS